MYIEPNTNIKLLRFNATDNTYKNTLYFSSRDSQYAYFASKAKYNLTDYTYQRVSNGVCRVGINAESLYDCNYMMFQNASFGSRWFYAFITDVRYVNNGMSEVQFEIDEFQTWFLDCTLRESFVVREHIENDSIGANLVSENLELGEYLSHYIGVDSHMTAYSIVVCATVDENGEDVADGATYGGIYGGCNMIAFSSGADVNSFLSGVQSAGKGDAIVSIFYMPRDFVAGKSSGAPKSYSISITKGIRNYANYTPRNNKLLTYPYNFLYVTNNEGSSGVFPFEFFSGDSCNFNMSGDYSPTCSVILTPTNFKGLANNFDCKLVISNFPQCSWNNDSFKQWLANSKIDLIRTGGAVVAGAIGASTLNPLLAVGGVSTAITSIADVVASGAHSYIQPPQARGSSGNATQVAMRKKEFSFERKEITTEYAKIIDDYFDMFGYATHRVKKPNISSRPQWNYVETRDCNLIGNVPTDSLTIMKDAFNRGITFWKNGDNVGNYSLSNK